MGCFSNFTVLNQIKCLYWVLRVSKVLVGGFVVIIVVVYLLKTANPNRAISGIFVKIVAKHR
jgi:hypothetical protein